MCDENNLDKLLYQNENKNKYISTKLYYLIDNIDTLSIDEKKNIRNEINSLTNYCGDL